MLTEKNPGNNKDPFISQTHGSVTRNVIMQDSIKILLYPIFKE